MAQQRASLDSLSLAGLKVPLTPTRDRRELVDAPEALPVASPRTVPSKPYESAADDPLVPYPIQLRFSQVQALKRLKSERGMVPAQLVREWVARGLRDLEG
jgi:hypothetical protein